MKIRRHISIIIATILMFFVSINSISVSAAGEAVSTEKTVLTAEADNTGNSVKLKWTKPAEGKEYSYTIHSKKDGESEFQTIPAKGSEKDSIKVLNIYPVNYKVLKNGQGKHATLTPIEKEEFENWKGEKFNLPASARLKRWMEEKTKDELGNTIKGYGKGIIDVDGIGIDEFNEKAKDGSISQLLGSKKSWNYDVIMIGSWDYNGNEDMNEDATGIIKSFIEEGHGVLFGHDVISSLNQNEYDTFKDLINIKLKSIKFIQGEQIKVQKKGLLTQYPWNIGEVGKTLTIPHTHTQAQLAFGDVWMSFAGEGSVSDDGKGEQNVYLTTWNNTAMIETGHSNGNATEDEQKLLANTLFYLAQVTDNTSWDDHKGRDLAAPDKPNITDVKYDKENKKTNIKFNSPKDNGSTYDYYVEATEKGTGNKLPKSDNKSATVTTGIKGYAVVVDKNKDTKPDKDKDFKENTNKEDGNSYTIDGELDKDFYVHVAAVDNAGNMSEVSTYTVPTLELTQGEVTNNTVKITAQGNDSVTKITLPDTKGVTSNKCEYTVSANGTYTFVASDKYGNEVTKSIKVNNLPTNVTLDDIKVNEKSTSLSWSVADDTQAYSYNLNSKKSDETEFTSTAVNGTSYEDVNAKDVTAPSKADITNVNIDKKNNKTTIKFNGSVDNGTSYSYNVDATGSESGVKSTSETKSATVMSGLKEYYVVIDENADTKFDTITEGTITTTSTEYTFDKAYKGHFYVHVAAVDNAGNVSEVSTYECNKPVLTLTENTDKIVKDNITITADASNSLRNVVKIIIPDKKEVSGNKAEYKVDTNGKYTFIAVDENGNESTETIEIKNIVPDVILNVVPDSNYIYTNREVTVDLTINNINHIYGTEVKMEYDSSKLEFLGFEKVEGVSVVKSKAADGEITLALVSLGIQNPMENKSLIKMKFKTIQSGEALINITRGVIADAISMQRNLRDGEYGKAIVNIYDKKFTFLDVTIIGSHYGEDPKAVLEKGVDADLNHDGNIDEADYKIAYELVLQNPDNDFEF